MTDPDAPVDGIARFPAWQAPVVSAVLFAVLAFFTADEYAQVGLGVWVGGHIVVGASIGLLVSLCDGPGPGTLLSRFLALISVVTALVPILGLPFNVAAFWMNRPHPGFHRTVSRVTLAAGVLVSSAALIFLIGAF